MPVMMIMEWDGISLDDYERARDLINWEGNVPDGAIFHVVSHDGSALRVTDIWESGEAFQRFVDDRLMPGVRQLGIQGQPKVDLYPVHRIFSPAFRPLREIASQSSGRS